MMEKQFKQYDSCVRDKRTSIKNAGQEILSSISKSTPINNKHKNDSSQNLRDFSKNSFLMRDKINNTPGFGLWCTNIKENPNLKYDKLQINELVIAGVKNFSVIEFKSEIEHKTIDILKIQVSDLISNLERAVGNFHDANVIALRAEELKESYHQVAQAKILEWKEVSEISENLAKENLSLKEALGNSNKEIARLSNELKSEKKNFEGLSESFRLYSEEKEDMMMNLTNQVKDLEEKLELVTIERNYLKRFSKGTNELESAMNKQSIEDSREVSRGLTPKNDTNDLILKFQLEMVDLKNKMMEEETQRIKLMDVLKSKKFKIKNLKIDMDKLMTLFDECSKDMKWNHDLVNRKKSMIKSLKDEINIKHEKEQTLIKEVYKLKNTKPKTNDIGVQKDDDLIKIIPRPKLFF